MRPPTALFLNALIVMLLCTLPARALPIDNRVKPDGTPVLLPEVQRYEPLPGTLALPDEIAVAAPDELANEVEVLAALVKRHFPERQVRQVRDGAAFCRLELTDQQVPESPEGYTMAIENGGVTIRARDARGIYYGVRTLGNLLRNASRPELPNCRIDDWPLLSIRGIFLNLRRMSFDGCMPELLSEIDAIGALKYNYAMLEFGEKFPYKDNPFTNRENGYSPEDIQAIKDAARRNHIEIIPMLQILSHDEWLHAHPRYREEMAENPKAKGWRTASCPLSTLVREVQTMAIREQIECFRPKFFNLSMDEIASCPWAVCPRCKRKDPKRLWQDATLLYTNEVLRQGVRPILFHDMFYPGNPVGGVELLPLLSKAVVFCNWDYGIELRKSRFPFFRGKGFQLFSMSYCRRMDNLRTLPLEALRQGCDGVFLSFWGQFRYPSQPTKVTGLGLSGFTLGGCYEWNPHTPPHTALPFDPAWETLRLILPEKCVEAPPETRFAALPLDQAFNARLGRDRRFPQTDAALVAKMASEAELAAEKFHLAAAEDGGYFAVVLDADVPEQQSVTIPVNATAPWLAFVTTAGRTPSRPRGRPVVTTLTVNYEDGATARIPLAYNQNLAFWNHDGGAYGARMFLRFNDRQGALVTLFAQNWRNPHPEKPIRSIVIAAAAQKDVPVALLAISVGDCAEPLPRPDDAALARRLAGWSAPAAAQTITQASPNSVVISDFSGNKIHRATIRLSATPSDGKIGKPMLRPGDDAARSCFNGPLGCAIVNAPDSPAGGKVLKLSIPALKSEYATTRCRLVVDLSFDRTKAGDIKTVFFDFKVSHPGYHEWPAIYLMSRIPVGNASYMGFLEGRRDRQWHHLALPFKVFKQDKRPLDLAKASVVRLSFFLRELAEPSEICIGPVGVSPLDTRVLLPLRAETVPDFFAPAKSHELFFID